MSGRLAGSVAVVTGGGTGIGKAVAIQLLAQECRVVIAGRDATRLAAAAAAIDPEGEQVVAVPADVTSEEQVRALFDAAISRFGRLDLLVNSAGAFDGAALAALELDAWRRVMDVNVTGMFLCCREAFRIMGPAGGGRIVNIGSIAAKRPRARSAAYTASKHAVWGLTQAAALEGREMGIAVGCLNPGNTAVERRFDGSTATGAMAGEEPLIFPEDVARTVLLMATLPPDANLLEADILPLAQPYIGRG